MAPSLLTVVGATGIQGGAVIEAALAAGHYNIRGITRDASSTVARQLHQKGVEMVEANLNDYESVKRAFAGSDAIFGVTDFFKPFVALGNDVAKAVELEQKHAFNIVTAAADTITLKHFLWSTLTNASRISNGKYDPAHAQGKNFADEHIEKHLPGLWAKTTFLWVGWYSTNVLYPIFKPSAVDNSPAYLQFFPAAADTPVPAIGNTKNIGSFVVAALRQPEKTLPGRIVIAALDVTTFGSLLDDWSKATGKQSLYLHISADAYRRLFPGWGEGEAPLLQFYDEYRGKLWDQDDVLSAKDLGIDTSGMEDNLQMLRTLPL